MKLTEAQIWKCNSDGEGGFHICLDHQNVVDFARAIEREIGFAKAELWLKRINDAVLAEREECAKLCEERGMVKGGEVFATRIRARTKP